MNKPIGSLEATPTWAVSVVCFFLLLISVLVESALHLLTKFLKRRKRKSLNRALGKIKTELMIMGFISLLLTVSEAPISRICVTKAVATSFLPCRDPFKSDDEPVVSSSATQIGGGANYTTLSAEAADDSTCEAKGKVSLVSREGIKQLHIFIFVLAVFHVLYCLLTMCLGIAKMKRWKTWEGETRTLEYQIENDPRRFRLTRQTSFGRRHLKFWSNHPALLWPVCFQRQFSGSVPKADYLTLRNGFIVAHLAEGSNFDFQKFLARAFDDDFVKVVGISFWVWIFSIFFIFFSAHEFYNHFWLPFIPLVMVLVVGTKLEVIITKMCLESRKNTTVVRGAFLVKPDDDLFWFGRPQWLLHLIQFILFQADHHWHQQYEYGSRSCFHRETEDIVLRIAVGMVVQFLCGYVTLPLYALVTQMGSGMKAAIFTERVAKGLKNWHDLARRKLSRNRSISSIHSSEPQPIDSTETSFSDMQEWHNLSRNRSISTAHSSEPQLTDTTTSFSDMKELHPEENIPIPPPATTSSTSIPEITEEAVQENHLASFAVTSFPTPEKLEEATHHKIITRGTYDGEISFGTSWKELGSGKGIEDITSALDDTAPDILQNRV